MSLCPILVILLLSLSSPSSSFLAPSPPFIRSTTLSSPPSPTNVIHIIDLHSTALFSSATESPPPTSVDAVDRIINLRPAAVTRLTALVASMRSSSTPGKTVLRMGVKSGGCSGMSYVMDFCEEGDVTDEDQVDFYDEVAGGLKCAVDVKSSLYLFGMELDFSDELIGGGFQFHNPNAEESCGCGKSFGV